jgi:hypothetical protein
MGGEGEREAMTETIDEEIAERAGRLAAEYEKTCTGCAQAAVAGLFDALAIEVDRAEGRRSPGVSVAARHPRRSGVTRPLVAWHIAYWERRLRTGQPGGREDERFHAG